MMHRIACRVGVAAFCLTLFAPLAMPQEQAPTRADSRPAEVLRITKAVRKGILTLTNYGVFDSLQFAIKGDTVILSGKASRPTLKSSAENVVKKIEGVEAVDNQIEVLPLSPNDDRIRADVYRSIYRFPVLQKYTSNRGGPRGVRSVARAAGGITNDPPIGYHAIHIIVENGNVTLTGVVNSEADLALAEMRANIVPGVFSVENDLQVPSSEK